MNSIMALPQCNCGESLSITAVGKVVRRDCEACGYAEAEFIGVQPRVVYFAVPLRIEEQDREIDEAPIMDAYERDGVRYERKTGWAAECLRYGI